MPLIIIANAQAVVEVDGGDWVRYGEIQVIWNPTFMQPSSELAELNNTLWFENEVLDIEDTLISLKRTTQYKNETRKTSVLLVDVNTGIGNGTCMQVASAQNPKENLKQQQPRA